MAIEIRAQHALTVQAILGEGPAWHEGALWFCDIKRHLMFRWDPVTGALDRWAAPEQVSWVLPSSQGGFIVGLKAGPHRFDLASGAFDPLSAPVPHPPGNRLNDAITDTMGRLWYGTMDDGEQAETGRLFVDDGSGPIDTGVPPTVITNGPGVSPDGRTIYHVETVHGRITRYANQGDGLGAGEPFLVADGSYGHPDGAICDSAGGLWQCFFGGSQARRYDPDGTCTHIVRFPTANVTKIAFGGPDLTTAYATTARWMLDDGALAAQPFAGDLFTFAVEVPGLPVTPTRL